MNDTKIIYGIKIASAEEIFLHLKGCSSSFIPNLGETVDIQEYTNKIFLKSITFEAWVGEKLIGLVACYFNDNETHSAYITNVSITTDYMGLGLASLLVKMCIIHAKVNNFSNINLEVNKMNAQALHLYKKIGFKTFKNKGNSILMKLEFNSK